MNFYKNLSPSMQLVVSGLISLLGTAIVTTIAATYQSYTQAGHLDVGSLINYAIVTFVVLIGKALYDYVPAHAKEIMAAYEDEQSALHDSLTRQQGINSAMVATQGKNVTSAPSQPQPQPHIIVQPPASLKLDDIQAISAQLAINLMHMAGTNKQDIAEAPAPAPIPDAPVQQQPFPAPTQPVVDPNAYVDPLRNSAVLPAYTPAIPDQATQSVPVAS